MMCPKCGGQSEVYDTRPVLHNVRRLRRCLKCFHAWRTWEECDSHEVRRRKQEREQAAREGTWV